MPEGRSPSNGSYSRFRSAKRWVYVGVMAVAIICYSHLPISTLPQPIPDAKIVIHLLGYTILAILLTRALDMPWRSGYQIALMTMATIAIFGACDELLQAFSQGRMVLVTDWIIDAFGGILGALIATWLNSTTWMRSLLKQKWHKQKQHAIDNNDTFSTY